MRYLRLDGNIFAYLLCLLVFMEDKHRKEKKKGKPNID